MILLQIAHVDHGKTTLVDCLLKQSNTRVANDVDRLMDSNQLEMERGITITSKSTSVEWKDPSDDKEYHFHIVDTPGHADFGGEVERIMSMVDGVALVVDATDGPMTQTKFVLSKALARGLSPFVIVNKVDRPTGRPGEVYDEVFDLFDSLGASDEQLDFPIIYASARDGWALPDVPEKDQKGDSMDIVYKTLVDHVPAPNVGETKGPFKMLASLIDKHAFFGKCFLGRVESGTIKVNDKIVALGEDGEKQEDIKVLKLLARRGMDQVPVDVAEAGDIVSISAAGGYKEAAVNSTLCDSSVTESLPFIPIDPPTLSMKFSVNSSPLSGTEGVATTAAMLENRLSEEIETNVSMKMEKKGNDAFIIYGRGELQLGIVVETMRREGMEMSLSPPEVVYQEDENGELLEPMEEVVIDVLEEHTGTVIEKMSLRKAEMLDFVKSDENRSRLTFHVPTRGLVGYAYEFTNDTRATGTLNHVFHSYVPHVGNITRKTRGALISAEKGTTTGYALHNLQNRGTLFVKQNTKVYPGMVIGECAKEGDLEVNPCKAKQLTNVRNKLAEEVVRLTPPIVMNVEESIAYCRPDEMIEVTADNVRLRKAELCATERKKLRKGKQL